MSRKFSPTIIGGFVVGALVLLTVAVAVFGGKDIFASKIRLVSYFEGSVKGLTVGSDVTFKGVRVGSVESIVLRTDIDTLDTKAEVVMEIFPKTIKLVHNGKVTGKTLGSAVSLDRLLAAGFSAQLELESLVTVQLQVSLDFRPGRQLVLRGVKPRYPEVPTVPSDIQLFVDKLQSVVATLEKLPVEDIVQRVDNILTGLDNLINSPDVRQALASVNRLVSDPQTQALGRSAQAALGEVRAAAGDARSLFQATKGDVDQISAQLGPAVERLSSALAEAELAIRSVGSSLRGDTPQAQQIQATLSEVESAARSARALFDSLDRHPEALLRGKRK